MRRCWLLDSGIVQGIEQGEEEKPLMIEQPGSTRRQFRSGAKLNESLERRFVVRK